jgi:hypothetical protein
VIIVLDLYDNDLRWDERRFFNFEELRDENPFITNYKMHTLGHV